jgi:PKD repeat protein
MKKLFSIILFAAFVFNSGLTIAQCTPLVGNTSAGFTPTSSTITQNASVGQTIQVYVPGTISTFTIDSLVLTSITGLPTGITATVNPVSGHILTSTVGGNGLGCIWLQGTTSDTVGTYTFVFNGTITTTLGAFPISVVASQDPSFGYKLTVHAPAVQESCDTIFSLPLTDEFVAYTWQAPGVGYISGNGAIADQQGALYPALDVAEEFTGAVGDSVTSVALGFYNTAIKSTDSLNTVKVYIYDNTGTSGVFGNTGAPGNRIDSTTITLKEAALAATNSLLLPVFFPTAPVLTTAQFFVVLALPATTGDTLILLTDTIGGGGNGWANYGNGAGWASYDSLLGGTLGNLVVVKVCGAATIAPTAAFTASSTSGCAPVTVIFTDHSTGNPASWSWNFGDGTAASTTQNPSHTFTTAGAYTVVETATNTGGNGTSSQSITVNPDPTATTSATSASSHTSANGVGTVVAAGGTAPYTYLWSNDGSTADTIDNVNPGTYSVTVTDANTCTATASVIVNVTGIINLSNAATVKIYPNPATDVLNLVWSQSMNVEVSVLDLNGNVISTMITNGDMKTAFDIHSLAAGAYIVRITDKSNNQQQSMLFSKF